MRRVVVAYLLRGEASERVNHLRRQYDPRTAAAIPAHVTLAGPVNTPAPLDDLIRALYSVAGRTAPLALRIGAVATFLPVSATTFLEVEPRASLTALHDLQVQELGWTETYPYHPHVTVTEYLDRFATEEAYRSLRGIEVEWLDYLDRITLLEKLPDGRWISVANAALNAGL